MSMDVYNGHIIDASALSNKRKRPRRKSRKRAQALRTDAQLEGPDTNDSDLSSVEVEYIVPDILDESDPSYEEFKLIFSTFEIKKNDSPSAGMPTGSVSSSYPMPIHTKADARALADASENDQAPEDEDDEEDTDKRPEALSKKKARKLNRMSVAQLKTLIKRPEVVDWVDVTAPDPVLLSSLKCVRSTVPVPGHWSQKRKYLQGKRGIEKPPFELPSYIRETGIMEMRQALREKESTQSLKTKTRARLVPKMGKLSIDYEKLHDAFFRFQTKPNYLTGIGDLYYEGKEFELKQFKDKKPGMLSEELKIALGMSHLLPSPWLHHMQRYGPPPSYPHLKIPGLNCPIPEGAQWGFQPGGWGKPPVDEFNRPLYGDVFGLANSYDAVQDTEPVPTKTLWGELEVDSFAIAASQVGPDTDLDGEGAQFEDEDHDADEERSFYEQQAIPQPIDEYGVMTPSGISSIATGLSTPDHIELRKELKRNIALELEQGNKPLYQILPTKQAGAAGILASSQLYQVPSFGKTTSKGTMQVSIDPNDLDSISRPDVLASKYIEPQDKGRTSITVAKEDFSDMIADHAAKQEKKKKLKEASTASSKKSFKF